MPCVRSSRRRGPRPRDHAAAGPSRAGLSHGPGGDGRDRGDPVRRALADTIRTWQLDVETLTPVFTALREDASGRRPQTWREWSLRTQAENTPWAMWCLTLLTRAGVPTTVRQEHLEAMPAFLDGLYLTDTLTDLASDLGRGILTLPEEALAAHGVPEADLLACRWTPPVEALIMRPDGPGRRLAGTARAAAGRASGDGRPAPHLHRPLPGPRPHRP